MITITGGKLTTWRRMAQAWPSTALVERDARDAPCRTHEIPLGQAVDPAALPRVDGGARGRLRALAGRYGHAAHEVLRIAAERGELAAPIVADGPPDLLAEAVVAARLEQATHGRRRPAAPHAHRAAGGPGHHRARRRRAASPPRWRPSWAGTRAAIDAAAAAFLDEAAAEGIVLGPDAVGATA